MRFPQLTAPLPEPSSVHDAAHKRIKGPFVVDGWQTFPHSEDLFLTDTITSRCFCLPWKSSIFIHKLQANEKRSKRSRLLSCMSFNPRPYHIFPGKIRPKSVGRLWKGGWGGCDVLGVVASTPGCNSALKFSLENKNNGWRRRSGFWAPSGCYEG